MYTYIHTHYSYLLNPIEVVWSSFKSNVKKQLRNKTQSLLNTPRSVQGYIIQTYALNIMCKSFYKAFICICAPLQNLRGGKYFKRDCFVTSKFKFIFLIKIFFFGSILARTKCPPLPKVIKMGFLVPKEAQCSESYAITIFQFFRLTKFSFSWDRFFDEKTLFFFQIH